MVSWKEVSPQTFNFLKFFHQHKFLIFQSKEVCAFVKIMFLFKIYSYHNTKEWNNFMGVWEWRV